MRYNQAMLQRPPVMVKAVSTPQERLRHPSAPKGGSDVQTDPIIVYVDTIMITYDT